MIENDTLVKHKILGYEGLIDGQTRMKLIFTGDRACESQYRIKVFGQDKRFIAPEGDLEIGNKDKEKEMQSKFKKIKRKVNTKKDVLLKTRTIIGLIMMVSMLSFKSFAAQIVPIPAISMTKVDGSFVATAPGQALWVTSTGIATLSSSGNTVVVEKGGTATINGDNEKVYLKSGGTLIINGAGNTVYYENGSQLTATGAGSNSIQVDGFSS